MEQLGSGPISKVFQLSSPALAKHSDFPLTNPIQTQDAKPIRTSMGIFPDIERGILAMLERRTICLTISPWFRFRLSLMGLGLHESYHHWKDFHIPGNLDHHKQLLQVPPLRSIGCPIEPTLRMCPFSTLSVILGPNEQSKLGIRLISSGTSA